MPILSSNTGRAEVIVASSAIDRTALPAVAVRRSIEMQRLKRLTVSSGNHANVFGAGLMCSDANLKQRREDAVDDIHWIAPSQLGSLRI